MSFRTSQASQRTKKKIWDKYWQKKAFEIYERDEYYADLSKAKPFQAKERCCENVVFVEESEHLPSESGVGDRHNLHKNGKDAYVSDGDYRLEHTVYRRL